MSAALILKLLIKYKSASCIPNFQTLELNSFYEWMINTKLNLLCCLEEVQSTFDGGGGF